MSFGMWGRGVVCNSRWRNAVKDHILLGNIASGLSRGASISTGKGVRECDYLSLLTWRRLEAHRSVLVQHGNRLGRLLVWLQKSGRVKHIFCFERAERPFALVEFASAPSVADAVRRTVHFPNERRIAVASRLLFLKRSAGREPAPHSQRIVVERDRPLVDSDLLAADSVSAQMRAVHTHQRLTELDTRLRFFVASCVEDALRGIFPAAVVTPFGSSVNGFGRRGCDLDMVLDLEEATSASARKGARPQDGAMYFMTKQRADDARLASQNCLEAVGCVLQQVAPQCVGVRRILHARVPIVKFVHSGADIECDLCLSNRSALLMSQFLYACGEFDARVRPFVFAVRHWARAAGVTFSAPGPWISNFTLAVLAIYYLQRAGPRDHGPVLPPLTGLADVVAGGADQDTEYRFISDQSRIKRSGNNLSLECLLRGFFEFYATADFAVLTPSLVATTPVRRPNDDAAATAALYIENPFDRELNVAKNVMPSYADGFRRECARALERLGDGDDGGGGPQTVEPWGLARVLGGAAATDANGTDDGGDVSVDVGGIFDLGEERGEEREEGGGGTGGGAAGEREDAERVGS